MKLNLIFLFSILFVNFSDLKAQSMKIYKTDGSMETILVSDIDSVVFAKNEKEFIDSIEYVDLDLPSGTLWAAKYQEEVYSYLWGDESKGKMLVAHDAYVLTCLPGRYAFGELSARTSFSESNYSYQYPIIATENYYVGETKYYNISSQYDAITQNWGDDWSMPTLEQVKELANNCSKSTYGSLDYSSGLILTSKKNGKKLVITTDNFWTKTSDYVSCTTPYTSFNWNRYDGVQSLEVTCQYYKGKSLTGVSKISKNE